MTRFVDSSKKSVTNHVVFLKTSIHRTNQGDVSGLIGVTKKAFNWMCENRTVSIREAQHESVDLPTTICSEKIHRIHLFSYYRLNSKSNDRNLLGLYARRKSHQSLSLTKYYYKVYMPMIEENARRDEDYKRSFLHGTGLNVRPTHPVDFAYARGLLILHRPWSLDNPIKLEDKEAAISEAEELLLNKQVPIYVYTAYNRVVKEKLRGGLADENAGTDYYNRPQDEEDGGNDLLDGYDYPNSATRPTNGKQPDGIVGGQTVDVGLTYDWSEKSFKGERDTKVNGEDYIKWAVEKAKQHKPAASAQENDELDIPDLKNKGKYSLHSLPNEQQTIALAVIDAVWKFLTNDKDFKPLRATVMAASGTGKSHMINTIVTVVRELTGVNDSVYVAAPTRGTAHNIGGSILHKLLLIALQKPWEELPEESKMMLKRKLQTLQVLIVDERNQLSSCEVAAAERHVRMCAFGGQNKSTMWAGIPVILFVGDDYQLPPILLEGAIKGYANRKTTDQHAPEKGNDKQVLTAEGSSQLIDVLTRNVFELTHAHHHQNPDTEQHLQLLERVRRGYAKPSDGEILTGLHWSLIQEKDDFKKHIETSPTTTYLFAHNNVKDEKNAELLAETSNRTKNPVARLRYVPKQTARKENCDLEKPLWKKPDVTTPTDICVGAKVAINAINYEPSWGLYNGASGTVVDIVYDNKLGPHAEGINHLPRYVVVDMPGFKPPKLIGPWDNNNPTVRTNLQTLNKIFKTS